MPDYRDALNAAIHAATIARRLLLAECARPRGPRGSGGHCPADEEAERLIRAELESAFPTWGYLGEETGSRAPARGEQHLWLVDPNDGTSAMLRGYRGHAVSVGLLREGVPVLGVVYAVNAPDDEGDLIAWAEGCGPVTRDDQPVPPAQWPRELGPEDIVLVSQGAAVHPAGNLACVAPARFRPVASIAYRLALVAVGEGAAGVSLNSPGAWDYGAGHALLRGAGGALMDESGAEVRYGLGGHSSTRWCFGGSPEVVRQLARRPWASVRGSGFGDAAPAPGFEPARLQFANHVHDSGMLRRAQGCVLGQLAGDALGSLVEFSGPSVIAARYPEGPRQLASNGYWQTMAGQPTDDSELALVLARTLLHQPEFDLEQVAQGYARWYHGWIHSREPSRCDHAWCRPFDIGGTTRQALSAVTPVAVRGGTAAGAAQRAANQESQANGALMRISPLGVWGANRAPELLAEAARADATLTHPHPVCQYSSALFAVAIAAAIRDGLSSEQTYRFALDWAKENGCALEVVAALESAATDLPGDFVHQTGWVLTALQNAFYQLLHAPSLEEGVVATVRQGGDTDTNAAICGALLGAVHGREAVPAQWRQMVLSCRPMPGYSAIRRPRPSIFWPADALELAERLLRVVG